MKIIQVLSFILLIALSIVNAFTRVNLSKRVQLALNAKIVDFAAGNPSFKTLAAAIKACRLESVLSGPGPYTLFAPNDEAFSKLPRGTVDALLKDIPKLTEILKYHIHPDKMNPTRSRVIDTLCLGSDNAPKQITIKVASWSCVGYCLGGHKEPAMCINTNDETAGGIACDNGVIHVVDQVLLPYEGNVIPTWGSVTMMGERDISGEAKLQKGYYGSHAGTGKGYRGTDKYDPNPFKSEDFKQAWGEAANWRGGIDGPSADQKRKYGQN